LNVTVFGHHLRSLRTMLLSHIYGKYVAFSHSRSAFHEPAKVLKLQNTFSMEKRTSEIEFIEFRLLSSSVFAVVHEPANSSASEKRAQVNFELFKVARIERCTSAFATSAAVALLTCVARMLICDKRDRQVNITMTPEASHATSNTCRFDVIGARLSILVWRGTITRWRPSGNPIRYGRQTEGQNRVGAHIGCGSIRPD
jgi:hypothetical protein